MLGDDRRPRLRKGSKNQDLEFKHHFPPNFLGSSHNQRSVIGKGLSVATLQLPRYEKTRDKNRTSKRNNKK